MATLYDMTSFTVQNIFAYIVLEGTEIDLNPVSATLKPTTDLDDTWPQAECCLAMDFKPELKEYEHTHPLPGGGAFTDKVPSLTRDVMTASFGEDSALHRMFQHGLAALPVQGAASVKPFADRSRRRKAWCQFVGVDLDGNRAFVMDVWCWVRAVENYKFGDALKPGLEFVNLGHETELDGLIFPSAA